MDFSLNVPGNFCKITQQKCCPSTYFSTKLNTAGNQNYQAVLSFEIFAQLRNFQHALAQWSTGRRPNGLDFKLQGGIQLTKAISIHNEVEI